MCADGGTHEALARARDKELSYETLRSQTLSSLQPPAQGPTGSALVLARQGLSTWMELDEPRAGSAQPLCPTPEYEARVEDEPLALPAPQRAALLPALVDLVLRIHSERVSA